MKKVVTHSGSFHADDVFAVAAFQLLLGQGEVQVMRTRDDAVIASGDYVVDVGGVYDHDAKHYDHHQVGAPVRENGIPYAGFGLMWRHYGQEICGSAEVAQAIEERLCIPIDASDNAINIWEPGQFELRPLEWDDIVKTWKAGAETDEDLNRAFLQVVAVARVYLEKTIQKLHYKFADRDRAEALYASAQDRSVIVSDEPVSRRWFIDKDDVNIVVHPRNDGAWMAIAVQKDSETYETKVQFPESWAGLRDADLAQVSGLPDAIFCHKNLYLFAANSQESAIEAARLAA